jgi:hypothetical protein
MRFIIYFTLAAIPGARLAGQVPQSAGLWDLPATTVAKPAALETGAVGMFWNPAAVLGSRHTGVGAQAIQTSDVVGVGGAIFGISQPLNRNVGVGLILGRVQVRDLVRTTTSPIAEPGDIPVYEQNGGVVVGLRAGPASLAASVRAHDSRFDAARDWGVTTDVGLKVIPIRRLTLAATTRFQPIDFSGDAPARYSAGAEYRALEGDLWGAPASATARYGFLVRTDGGTEHSLGGGLSLADRLSIDAGYTRESSFESTDWRLALALGIRAGRYDILAARGSGIRGIGANYRVGLEVDFK